MTEDGIMLVRRTGAAITWTPTQGVSYSGSIDVDHEVVYKGSATSFQDTNVSNNATYYYQAYSYTEDYGYSLASTMKSVTYVNATLCGNNAANNCYVNSTATTAEIAATPSGKLLEYVTASGGFKVWKEKDGSRILRPNGLDAWAMRLNPTGKDFSSTEFAAFSSIVGRVCPPNVYITDTNAATKFSTGNCLYYTSESSKALNADGVDFILGFENYSTIRWYTGNIKVCSDKGMRLPTLFERIAPTPRPHISHSQTVHLNMDGPMGYLQEVPQRGQLRARQRHQQPISVGAHRAF